MKKYRIIKLGKFDNLYSLQTKLFGLIWVNILDHTWLWVCEAELREIKRDLQVKKPAKPPRIKNTVVLEEDV